MPGRGLANPPRPSPGKAPRTDPLSARPAQIGIIPAGLARTWSSVRLQAEIHSGPHMQGWIEARTECHRSCMRGNSLRRSVRLCSIRWRASRLPLAARRAIAVNHTAHGPVTDWHARQSAKPRLVRSVPPASRQKLFGLCKGCTPRQPGVSG